MADTPYTMADLEAARADLTRWIDAFANDSSNNPNKFRSQIKAARMRVRTIEAALKIDGTLPLTEQERVENELDKLHPDAHSKMVADYNGKKYRRWYYPAEKSNSGKTVQVWDRGWEEVKPE